MQAKRSSPFAALRAPAASLDEVDVALMIDRLLAPAVDPARTRSQLTALCAAKPAGQSAWAYLEGAGFQGNRSDYADRNNSSLSWVLRHRRGIPITLAVLLLAVARSAGATAYGVNNPGHFLVDVGGVLVDPFSMRALDSQAQAPRTPVADFAQRMLNNLKYGHAQLGEWDLALDMLDHQRAIDPESFPLAVEEAGYWERLGAREHAMERYTALLVKAPNEEVRAQLEERVARLDGSDGAIWH